MTPTAGSKAAQDGKGPPYLQFAHLSRISGLVHAVFTRRGGVSTPPFDSLNTSLSVGDAPANVYTNRDRIQHALDAPLMVFPRQVHGCCVAKIDSPDDARPAPEADALVTRRPGIFLAIQVADCQAVLVVDPQKRVVANIHAGWRGTVQNIVGQTVRTMVSEYGCRTTDLQAGIGPSLGPCCAEFINYRRELPARLWSYQTRRHYFDFRAITRDQLLAEGLNADHIQTMARCTRCHPRQFFSYRHAPTTGRFTAVIGLQQTF